LEDQDQAGHCLEETEDLQPEEEEEDGLVEGAGASKINKDPEEAGHRITFRLDWHQSPHPME
jgi:hypothetical protein